MRSSAQIAAAARPCGPFSHLATLPQRWEGAKRKTEQTGVDYENSPPGRIGRHHRLGFGELLTLDDLTPDQRESTHHILKGGHRLLDLIPSLKDAKGERVHVDDPRIDPLWRKAGELGIPVLIHTGEPPAFFQPVDKHNERLLELSQFPERARPPERYPTFEQLMTEQHSMFRKHPRTKFINAHLGWLGADLGRLGALLDSLPNMYTELGAVLYEIGRQPRFARQFFIKYQDRILMGKDITEDPSEYHVYFRVLETGDEYFDYYRKRHAFWRMYGLELPDEVLKKVYYKNALRIIPGIDASAFPQ
jgi:hypothetical protein